MVAALLIAHLQAVLLGACPDGAIQSCSLPGCPSATRECVAPNWGPCVCSCTVGQTCGPATTCKTYTYNSACECVATVTVGASCNDANACTTNDRCDASGKCAGTPVNLDDGNPCTFDRCDPTTGAITHPLASSESACSSGTYFCYDKYGNVTKKVVCIAGAACDMSCP